MDLKKIKSALRQMASAVGYKLTIEADDSGYIEYFLSGGQAFNGEKFFAGTDFYDALETLEAHAGGHENYESALAQFRLMSGVE